MTSRDSNEQHKCTEHKHDNKLTTSQHDQSSDNHTHDHASHSDTCSHAKGSDHKHAHSHDSHSHHHHGHSHHGHSHHGHVHGGAGNRQGLAVALSITGGIMVLEFVGGLLTNSLALLSDSGHMLSDTAAIALSLLAFWFAAKPATAANTYGYHRFEILAALFNALTLFVIAGIIGVEAYHRLSEPPEVAGLPMMAIAAVGLLANLLSAWALIRKGDIEHNLNVRSAYLHILGDALGSVGAIVAALLVTLFGWNWADPVVSVLVALLILRSAWGILKSVIHILMEGAPADVDSEEVRETLLSIEGVRDIHDLHIWTITSGLPAISGHLLVQEDIDCQQILREALAKLESQFGLTHATLQIEKFEGLHQPLKV
ncbi:cobalt-zinc-cadmium efflux system protein [Paenibacillus cellulosilyticus]|uniref:Cobalt-zinc-cadmium efflux system protein n=1 Tax=Paenibacillus cellulosilyticus TaxID=375489 RepID=A0A2V2YSM3_9BACL|nr:cation diffusion facilitator family transporter [Paenibacillus cellulosilyticus]PWV97926.1 cobalt-zinc-cadmium efflux system protein [Paenibacillus cellulosilyticus]QKS44037.1 cation transporter [Paenibacillus cellulosilyticus]